MTTPKGYHILVKPDEVPDTFESGLIKAHKSVANTGVVLALSPDYEFPLKVGDRIRYIPTHQEVLPDGTALIRADEEGCVLYVIKN
jgi:hypothetical protein